MPLRQDSQRRRAGKSLTRERRCSCLPPSSCRALTTFSWVPTSFVARRSQEHISANGKRRAVMQVISSNLRRFSSIIRLRAAIQAHFSVGGRAEEPRNSGDDRKRSARGWGLWLEYRPCLKALELPGWPPRLRPGRVLRLQRGLRGESGSQGRV